MCKIALNAITVIGLACLGTVTVCDSELPRCEIPESGVCKTSNCTMYHNLTTHPFFEQSCKEVECRCADTHRCSDIFSRVAETHYPNGSLKTTEVQYSCEVEPTYTAPYFIF